MPDINSLLSLIFFQILDIFPNENDLESVGDSFEMSVRRHLAATRVTSRPIPSIMQISCWSCKVSHSGHIETCNQRQSPPSPPPKMKGNSKPTQKELE